MKKYHINADRSLSVTSTDEDGRKRCICYPLTHKKFLPVKKQAGDDGIEITRHDPSLADQEKINRTEDGELAEAQKQYINALMDLDSTGAASIANQSKAKRDRQKARNNSQG